MSNPKPQGGNGCGSSLAWPTCAKCGKKHDGKCLADTNGCFSCGKSGHKMRDHPMLAAKGREGKQAPPRCSNANVPKQNQFYALQTRGDQESSPNVLTNEENEELVRDVHRLVRLGVQLVDSTKGGVMVHNGFKSSLVLDLKSKQGLDPVLVELKEAMLKKSVEDLSQGEMECLGIKEVYWCNEMMKYIAEFVVKCPNYQQVKVEHQRPGGLSQDIAITTWKWEDLNMNFIVGLLRTQRQYDSIWVIVDRMTKLAYFLPVKVSYSVEYYAKMYLREMEKLHGVHLSIISDHVPGVSSALAPLELAIEISLKEA
ncbi:uncharacterized protein LOC125809059 [Solanum verrucosum]|uniref:uncharacterized protein LOC125809059 n=1 Tax=Solanum verrucosum TaxID=315347 RepID=UPI0020CFF215|nr:uncharacterized protein LOC125809059 [Solanum verrucosum]